MSYEFMVPNFKDTGCIVFLPCRNDWHIKNLLGASVRRVGGRTADASDATADFLRDHPAFERGPMEWTRLDARGGADTVASAARRLLEIAAKA